MTETITTAAELDAWARRHGTQAKETLWSNLNHLLRPIMGQLQLQARGDFQIKPEFAASMNDRIALALALADIDQQPTAQPTVEQVRAFSEALGRPESVVKAEALEEAATSLEGGLGVEGTPGTLYEYRAWLRARAAAIRGEQP